MFVKLKERFNHRKESGFSLLEIVVAVGILLVLTVGGLLAYNQITLNARQAAVNKASSEIYTMAKSYETDSDPKTGIPEALEQWAKNSGYHYKIEVKGDDKNVFYMVIASNSPVDLTKLETVQIRAVIYEDSAWLSTPNGSVGDIIPQSDNGGILVQVQDWSNADLSTGKGVITGQRG